MTVHLAGARKAFQAAFAGNKTTYGLVDSGNWNSGWEALGTWTAVAPAGSLPAGWTASIAIIQLGTAAACDEYYRFSGVFDGPDSFVGTFEAQYVGFCLNCQYQIWENLVGTRSGTLQ